VGDQISYKVKYDSNGNVIDTIRFNYKSEKFETIYVK